MTMTLTGSGTGTVGVPNVGTAVNASGTSVDFTGIPAGIKRITVMFNGVSTNGSTQYILQIGSGSFTTTGYNATCGVLSSNTAFNADSRTTGFYISNIADATATHSGIVTIANLGSNVWVSSGILKSLTSRISYSAGDVTLGGTLDRVRITTTGGTETFDAGSINILYE